MSYQKILTIEDAAGVVFQYKKGALVARSTRIGAVRVLSPGVKKSVEATLKTFGVEGGHYDRLQGSVIFEADVTTFNKVKEHYENNPLYVVMISVALIESELMKDEKVGFDWTAFSAQINVTGGLGTLAKMTGASSGSFVLSAAGDMVSLNGVLNSLESLRKYQVIQNVSIAIVNGENGVIDVSDKVPYVQEITIAATSVPTSSAAGTTSVPAISQNTDTAGGATTTGAAAPANRLLQSTKFGEVSSGLVIDLTPVINSDYVQVDVDIKYNAVKEACR